MATRSAVVAVALSSALVSGAAGANPAQREAGVARASEKLIALLAREHASDVPGHKIVSVVEDLGCGAVVRASFDPPLYPGSGVRTVVVGEDGRSYGQHGDHDVADFARACAWLTKAPAQRTLALVLSAAAYEGMMAMRVDPVVVLAGGVLKATIRRAEPLSGDEVEELSLEVGPRGPLVVQRRSLVVERPVTPPRTVLKNAATGVSVDAMELLQAVTGAKNSTDVEVLGWLAVISGMVMASDTIPTLALDAMGTTPTAVRLLHEAWATLPAERRQALLAVAGEMHGPGFREALER